MADFYVTKAEHQMVELRQERFREQLAKGKEHPHDICAVARSIEELKRMVGNFGWDIDYGE